MVGYPSFAVGKSVTFFLNLGFPNLPTGNLHQFEGAANWQITIIFSYCEDQYSSDPI